MTLLFEKSIQTSFLDCLQFLIGERFRRRLELVALLVPREGKRATSLLWACSTSRTEWLIVRVLPEGKTNAWQRDLSW